MFRLCRSEKKESFLQKDMEKKDVVLHGRTESECGYIMRNAVVSIRIAAAALCILLTGKECLGAETVTIAPRSSRTIAGTASPDEAAVLHELPICEEDEYVLLSVGDNYAEIYDNQGNYLSRCRTYMDGSYAACTIKKQYVLDYTDDKTWNVYSMPQLKTIGEFPAQDYQIQTCGKVFLATEEHAGDFTLYDSSGSILYESGAGQDTHAEVSSGQCQGRVLMLDDGYLIGSCRLTDGEYSIAVGPVWVSKDGQQSREITDEYLKDAFADWSLQEFGNYVLVFDWNEESGGIYDLDGMLLLDSVVSYFSRYTDDEFYSVFNPGENLRISLAMQEMDGMCVVYDTDLEECTVVDVTENGYWDYGYAGGFIKGASYRQLDGRACAGFVKYQNSCWCPYADTEDGCVIYIDGELLPISLDAGENVTQLNEACLVKGHYAEGSYSELLVNRPTEEILAESCWDETGNIYFTLGTDYCIITEETESDGGYRTKTTIRDEQNRICYESENARAYLWKNGYIVLNRGIYHGIADRNGSWIIKTVNGWEE